MQSALFVILAFCFIQVLSKEVIDFGGPFSGIVNVDFFFIYPVNGNFSDCEAISELPPGLTIVQENCTIWGYSSLLMESEEYTIVSQGEFKGSFLLTVKPCMYNSFDIVRTYGIGGIVFEVFDVTDAYTNEVLVNITMYAPKKSNGVFSYRFCRPTSVLKISLRSSCYPNWYQHSKLEVFSFNSNHDLLFRGRLDALAGLDQVHYVTVDYLIPPTSNWYYHFDSLPPEWESSTNVDDWKEASAFPESTNQIQLYKKLFFLSSVTNSSSLFFTIRYQEGLALYLNGKQLFVNHLPYTPLSESTVATGAYSNSSYHQVVLSQHYFQDDRYLSYLNEGLNVITVAVIHSTPEPFQAFFDLYVRFTGLSSQYRSYEMSAEITGLSGKPESLLDIDHESWVDMDSPSIPEASIVLQFPSNHREVISKVVLVSYFHDVMNGPIEFDIFGKEEETSDWVFLQHIESIVWKTTAQNVMFWINTNIPYNGLKFTHFSNDGTDDRWRLSEILLFSEQLNREVPPFIYQDIEQYQDVAIQAQLPPSPDYFNFHVSSELPPGLTLDLMDGELKGIPTEVRETTEFVITATRFDSQFVSCTLSITIPYCSGENSLYHITILTDKHTDDSYWKLFKGKDTQGEVVFDSVTLPIETKVTWSFCLPLGYYTFFFLSGTYGWRTPSAYSLATNHDHFPFATGTIPVNWYHPNSTVEFTIHTKQLFQPLTTEWKLAPATEPLAPEWKELEYEASSWISLLLKDLQDYPSDYPSFYLRKEFYLDDLTEFNSFLFQCQFSGGLIVYLNAYPVFRVNLPESPSRYDYSHHDHNCTKYSQFSIPLLGSSALQGKNVLAVEYHLAKDSTQPIVFDMISQFTVGELSVLPTSVSFMNGTEPYSSTSGILSNIYDMRGYTLFKPAFQEGTFFELVFENNAPIPFNAYGFLGGSDTLSFDYHLEGQGIASEEWVELDRWENFNITDRVLDVLPLPSGLTGWKRIRFVVDATSYYKMNLMEFMLLYQSPNPDGMCVMEDDFFGVSSMEWSYRRCERGYSGYRRRQCVNGMWGEEVNECTPNPLTYLYYPQTYYNLTVGIPFSIEAEMDGVATSIVSIPEGLSIADNGTIMGVSLESSHTLYSIIAMNDISVVNTTVEIEFHHTYCSLDNPPLRLKAGESVTLPCSLFVHNTLGKFSLKCEYATSEEGKWIQDSTTCITIGYVFGVVVVCICVLVIIITMIVKNIRMKLHNVL